MTGTHSRLQLASRIHLLLLQDLGHGIEVEQMLTQDRYARDVLLVCDALRGTELAQLAQQFRQASAEVLRPLHALLQAAHPATGAAASADWARDSSGFGVTLPPPSDDRPLPPHAARRSDAPPRRGR